MITRPGPVSTGMSDRVRGSSRSRKSISVYNQPRRLRWTQPGHPSIGRCNEYQPKGWWCSTIGE